MRMENTTGPLTFQIKDSLNKSESGLEETMRNIDKISGQLESVLTALTNSANAIEGIALTLESINSKDINDKLESIDSRIDEINERIGRSTILGRLGVK